MPLMLGSTTLSTNALATAASIAFPPLSRIFIPASDAKGWAELTTAVKVDGKRAYELARKEKNVLIKEKEITINEFKILNFSSPVIEFYISCSKGTYIRSIARDLGEKLGCGAYLSELRRTKIGSFCVDNADTIEELEQKIK